MPPEFVHSLLAVRRGTLPPELLTGGGAAPAMLAAQALAGNQAVARALQPPLSTPMAPSAPDTATPVETNEAGERTATDATSPAAAAEPEAAAAAPATLAAGGKSGGTPVPPDGASLPPLAGATPQAVQQQASAVAQSLPAPPATGGAGAVRPPARRQRASRARRVVGLPPVPTVTPAYATITDPIPEATKRIEAAANCQLPDVLLPAVEASPGGHMPNLTEEPLNRAQLRMILLGEQAMADARISDAEKQRLTAIRDRILKPPEAAPPAPGEPAITPEVTQITITLDPLPPASVTLAERDIFTAVIARLLADSDKQAKEILDNVKASLPKYPDRAMIEPRFPVLAGIGAELVPGITTHLRDAALPLAQSMGVAGATLDAAIDTRRQELETERLRAEGKLQQTADQATVLVANNADAQLQDAQQARTEARDARQRANAARHQPEPGFRDMAEAAVARIQDKVGEAIARFNLQGREREMALDKARNRQVAAYETAAAADQLAASSARSGGAQPADANAASLAQRRRVSEAINKARDWVTRKTKILDDAIERLKAEARAQTPILITAVETEGGNAYRDLRSWGGTQDGATDDWWQGNVRNLDQWANAAHDTATTWASAKSHLARLEMQRDLERVRKEIDRQLAADTENGARYQALTEDQRSRFVDQIVAGPAQQSRILEGLAAGLTARLVAAERGTAEPVIDAAVLALPDSEWAAVEWLAKATNSGFSAATRSNAIYSAGEDKLGTDEDTIYAQLEGLRPIELAAVRMHYGNRGGRSLDAALKSEMSGDELRRARALAKGNAGIAAAEAIHDAVWGPGTNEAAIMKALRALTPTERAAADKYYLDQYGESLDSRLRGDLSGSQLAQAQALLNNNTAEAEAFEIDEALRGGVWGPDRQGVSAVYDRVREESLKVAQRENWTPAELDAEIARRNQAIDARFSEKLSGVPQYNWGGRGQSTLQNAIGWAYPFNPAERQLITALADNDMPTADAALMQTERNGVYADDAVVKGVIRAQYDRAFERAQLARGPELRAGVDQQIQEEEAKDTQAPPAGRGLPAWTERKRMDRRMALQSNADRTIQDDAFDRAHASSIVLDTVMQQNHGISLTAMLDQNMSGGDRREAQAQLEVLQRNVDVGNADARKDRRLDWAYNRVRYAIEGVGTDMDELKGGLSGLTKDEIDELDTRWRRDHPNETLREAVQGDTSGREEDDLVDVVDHGAPTTVAERMDEMRRKLKRDEDSVGWLGASASANEARHSAAAIREMDELAADLDNPNLSPARRAHLAGIVDQRIEHANAAIEAQRAAVDSFADTLTTIFQYVVGAIAIVIGAIVAVVSGGTAVPALIAIAGSLVGTLGSMAIKRAVKGGAYGAEEIGTDLAVGAVDLVVTALTAGAFKGGGFLKGLTTELRTLGAASIRIAITQTGRRVAAMTAKETIEMQARRAGTSTLGRFATRVGVMGKALAKNQAEQFVTSLPTALAANVLNERNLRNGNPLKNIAHGTLDASLENLKMGAGMAVFGHVVGAGMQHALVVSHPPMSPVQIRLAEYQHWQNENPGKPRAQYVAELEATQARTATDEAQARLSLKEARRALLSEIPPRERAAIADVPIVRVGEAEFLALNGGRRGDAMIHVQEGQAAIVLREGAPASAVTRLAGELRATVAPGTAGRTANPAESLPPRLRNRVPVEVNTDPGFGSDTVRAVPQFHPDGHIIGIKLEIGPNARAVDIRNHIDTVDAMRKLTGLLGEARVKIQELQLGAGSDIVSPLDRGRWEASLEIAKLPKIIEERILRLSEQGLDPRRRALVMQEIDTLQHQYAENLQRFAQGADAQALGYVAARARKDIVQALPELDPAQAKQRGDAVVLLEKLAAVEPHYAQLSGEHDRLARALEPPIEDLRDLLAEFKSRSSGGARARRPTVFDPIEKLLDAGEDAAAMKALQDWLQDKPRTDFTDRLREAANSFDHARDALTLRENALLAELAPVEATRAQLLKDLASNPYYRERKLWFDQLRHGDLGSPGALICFPPETSILCEDGTKPIGELAVGQVVLAYDIRARARVPARLTATMRGWAPCLMDIALSDGHHIRATRQHPFFDPKNDRWVPARCLLPGAAMLRGDGATVHVVSAELDTRQSETCNLMVEAYHCYFAGESGYLVHNGDEDSTSHFENTTKRPGKIYVVREKATGEIIYVGKTYDLITTRWNAHLRNPRKGWSTDTHTIEIVKEKMMTDFEIAVWEEHYMRLNGGLKADNPTSRLINDRYEITAAKFREFRQAKYGHNPCI